MTRALTIPVLVTTDLPPQTDLAAFGRLVADAVAVLTPSTGVPYSAHLRGRAFWLDRPLTAAEPGAPAPPAEQLRFAALLGFLSVTPSVIHAETPTGTPAETPSVASGTPHPASKAAALTDARTAITAAVAAAHGDLGSPPAVLAIRAEDVHDRTPDGAVPAATAPSAGPAPAQPVG
ncbi:hypothetical protein ACFOWE_26000 [Planomonospora corallina]|uniref:Uncharacterized protein n=1 Tax=Planomonospora corallina TaxID=1806052 RepID=A0ABV8IJ08_9ACTN